MQELSGKLSTSLPLKVKLDNNGLYLDGSLFTFVNSLEKDKEALKFFSSSQHVSIFYLK